MSSKRAEKSRVEQGIDVCKEVFLQTKDSDIEPENEELKQDGSFNMVDDPNENDEEDKVNGRNNIPAGARTERWFQRFEEITSENRARSIENRNLLKLVDRRTVWIARLLIATLATILGGIAVQLLI